MVHIDPRATLIGRNRTRVRRHLGGIAILFTGGLLAIPVGRVLWQIAGTLWPGAGLVSATALTGLALPLILLVSALAIVGVAYDGENTRLGLSLVAGALVTVLAVWWLIDLFTAELIGLVMLWTALAAIATIADGGLAVCWGLTAAPVIGYLLTGPPLGHVGPVDILTRLGLGVGIGAGIALVFGTVGFLLGRGVHANG